MNWLGEIIQRYIRNSDTVLDLGCGIMQATDGLKCKNILGCDIWMSYLYHICDKFMTIQIGMNELQRFPNNSYDVVLCLDVIEHLHESTTLEAINEMKRIARRRVIIYTPNKFETNENAIENSWGLGKCEYQRHVCLFDEERLRGLGFYVRNDNEDGGNLAIFGKAT